jgi:hypothetical protein
VIAWAARVMLEQGVWGWQEALRLCGARMRALCTGAVQRGRSSRSAAAVAPPGVGAMPPSTVPGARREMWAVARAHKLAIACNRNRLPTPASPRHCPPQGGDIGRPPTSQQLSESMKPRDGPPPMPP